MEDILGPVAFAYNNSTHSSTSETPYFLNHGRDPVMPIDQFLLPLPSAIVTPSDYKSQIMSSVLYFSIKIQSITKNDACFLLFSVFPLLNYSKISER